MVQTNLGNALTHNAIKSACDRNGLLFQGVEVIPFSDKLPDVKHAGPVLAYGSTRFIKNVVDSKKWNPGAFFDEKTFTVANCISAWGEWMVNHDSVFIRLDSVATLPYSAESELFVRPNGDLKEFAGDVMTFNDLCDWAIIIKNGGFEFDGSLLVAVASAKPIKSEWRVFAVEDARVIAATRYRVDGRLAPHPKTPSKIISFVERRLQEWMPAPAVALDVAEIDNEIRIVELSDIHAAGHYEADIETIVVETSEIAVHHWEDRL